MPKQPGRKQSAQAIARTPTRADAEIDDPLESTERPTGRSPISELPGPISLSDLSPIEVADLILVALQRRAVESIPLTPDHGEHVLRGARRGAPVELRLPSSFADAVVARLALVGGLQVAAPGGQVGRLRVRPRFTSPAVTTDMVLLTQTTPSGLAAELHPVGGTKDARPPRAERYARDGTLVQLGRYRLLEEIGRGGMGLVFRAQHVVLRKQVAIKLLRRDVTDSPELVAQFEIEARAACRARHPNIIDVHDFGRLSDGRAYIVMELVRGETLDRILAHGRLEPGRALTLARRMAAGLRAASAHGVVHRDLKPNNVFVLDDDRVKLSDFGVASIVDAGEGMPRPGLRFAVVGTASYMSPEQARGAPPDVRSDIYSLGCVLFEMLTGSVPFAASTLAELRAHHDQTVVPPLAGPDGPLPEAVDRVVRRAMAKRIEERYQTVDEFLADLRRAARVLLRNDWRRWLPP